MVQLFPPDPAVRRLTQKVETLKLDLESKYGRAARAPEAERTQYSRFQNDLRTAIQKHRRRITRLVQAEYFKAKDKDKLQKQLSGIHEHIPMREIRHTPERQAVASILGDMAEDVSEDEIVKRKIDAINAMVAYAFIREPPQPQSPSEMGKGDGAVVKPPQRLQDSLLPAQERSP